MVVQNVLLEERGRLNGRQKELRRKYHYLDWIKKVVILNKKVF